MDLKDLLNDDGLQQDKWITNNPSISLPDRSTLVGWSGRDGNGAKFYIIKCEKCSEDMELFGEGYFKIVKGGLLNGKVPCGCSRRYKWSKQQYEVLCRRKASEMGYNFIGFDSIWKNQNTKIVMFCKEHGEWTSGTIANLLLRSTGCPPCGISSLTKIMTKPDQVMIDYFLSTMAFHPNTDFSRSSRLTSQGRKSYWNVSCPECGETGESMSCDLRVGKRPCACSPQRQQQAYINLIIDTNNNPVALKFGIARDSKHRIKTQNRRSIYEVVQWYVFQFPDVASCKSAERECLQTLDCGVLSRFEMVDGYTETVELDSIDEIIEIYQDWGGIPILQSLPS